MNRLLPPGDEPDVDGTGFKLSKPHRFKPKRLTRKNVKSKKKKAEEAARRRADAGGTP